MAKWLTWNAPWVSGRIAVVSRRLIRGRNMLRVYLYALPYPEASLMLTRSVGDDGSLGGGITLSLGLPCHLRPYGRWVRVAGGIGVNWQWLVLGFALMLARHNEAVCALVQGERDVRQSGADSAG